MHKTGNVLRNYAEYFKRKTGCMYKYLKKQETAKQNCQQNVLSFCQFLFNKPYTVENIFCFHLKTDLKLEYRSKRF